MAVALLGRLLCVAVLVSSSSAQVPANVAVGKTATQSSTFDGTDGALTYRASADLAVDGAPTKNYLNKTCAVTDWLNTVSCTINPWWQVDLGGLYDVFSVIIYQREGANNRGPLVVRVGDHVERPENRTLYNDRPIIPVNLSSPVTTSTVNISIIGCNILQLCEVEVFAVLLPANFALKKPATQSSTFDGTDGAVMYRASADLAVDGAPTKNYADKTCAVTAWQNVRVCTDNPWWQVDLGGLYDVFNVTIYQREGTGVYNRGPLVVRVGDHVERPENRTRYNDRPIIPINLSSPVRASTVNISIIGCSILQLCEVEVFAVQLPANFALKKPASQSSTFDGTDGALTYRASADLAVDGAPTKNYADKTCAVTDWLNGESCTDNPWWQVDLGGLYDVFNVTIYLRGRGAVNRGPLVVRVGGHVERPENRTGYYDRPVIPVLLSPPVTASTVNISIIGCNILQLCEVEVFSIRHVDECASNPCQHGGNCIDEIYVYTCHCVPGYTGVNCETDVNECLSNPCQHGTCTDGVSSYTCVCVPGYTGVHCETDINECEIFPCKNGALCQNPHNKFKCDCPAGLQWKSM